MRVILAISDGGVILALEHEGDENYPMVTLSTQYTPDEAREFAKAIVDLADRIEDPTLGAPSEMEH